MKDDLATCENHDEQVYAVFHYFTLKLFDMIKSLNPVCFL